MASARNHFHFKAMVLEDVGALETSNRQYRLTLQLWFCSGEGTEFMSEEGKGDQQCLAMPPLRSLPAGAFWIFTSSVLQLCPLLQLQPSCYCNTERRKIHQCTCCSQALLTVVLSILVKFFAHSGNPNRLIRPGCISLRRDQRNSHRIFPFLKLPLKQEVVS